MPFFSLFHFSLVVEEKNYCQKVMKDEGSPHNNCVKIHSNGFILTL